MGKARLIALLLAVLCGPALAEGPAPLQRLTCTRVSGAPMHDRTLDIDDQAKMLSVSPDDWFSPDQDPASSAITFKGGTIEWTFMRGYADLDRKTGLLDWDDTGEYDYLETIGQADAADSVENYRGRMQCRIVGSTH